MGKVVFAFSGAERGNQFADPAAEMWNGSLDGLAEKRFQLVVHQRRQQTLSGFCTITRLPLMVWVATMMRPPREAKTIRS
jgi:hypothetical protein